MPLAVNIETVQTIVSIKITRILNDTINARLTVSYDELDIDGNKIGNSNMCIMGIDDIRVMYMEIEDEIRAGKDFETASADVLYAKISTELGL